MLLAEFPLADEHLRASTGGELRWGDGLILPNRTEGAYLSLKGSPPGARLLTEKSEAQHWKDSVAGDDVVLVQTKERLLGPRVIVKPYSVPVFYVAISGIDPGSRPDERT